jgi:crotonobetainyl-CoA:carnitine CoA-transferase CaiB-like acyl-CoA transferase
MSIADRKPMLEGIRIIDLTSVVFGPFATQILADLGADVIKVEPPEGDQFRYSAKWVKTRGMSPGHLALNRGKRSITLDLKTVDDLETMKSLIRDCDVFVHNVRAGAITRLGLDYDAVRALNPNIIYIHCTGFGSEGPYAELQAYDDVIQAASGTTTLLSRVDGNPRPRYLPSLIADKVAGLHGAYATMAAIIHRLRTGEGQFVEVPMFESFTHFMLKEHIAGQTFDPPNGPICYARQIDPNRQPFPTADGYISIVPYTDEAWLKTFDVLGNPQIIADERFNTSRARVANLAGLYQAMAALTPAKKTAEWAVAFTKAGIPAIAVRDIGDLQNDPHLQATGFFVRREHPTEGDYFDLKSPVRFAARPTITPEPAPTVGQHNAKVKAEVERQ